MIRVHECDERCVWSESLVPWRGVSLAVRVSGELCALVCLAGLWSLGVLTELRSHYANTS
eukprot:1199878-Prymnesium_polylepis.1